MANYLSNSIQALPQWLRCLFIFPLVFLNGWLLLLLISSLQPLFSIFIAATLVAFLLDFPIRFLQSRGVQRGWAIVLVSLISLVVVSILGVTLIPLLVKQLAEVVTNLPQWIDSASVRLEDLMAQLPMDLDLNLSSELNGKIASQLQSLSKQLLNTVLDTLNRLINGLLVMVLTIFLTIGGDRLWDGIFSWLPHPWDQELRESIEQTFQRYFAGQAILAGILSTAQVMVFSLLNVPYAVLFAVAIGLTTLIPYASAFTIIIISIVLALQDIVLGLKILIAAIIVGQIIDNVVAPRLIGNMTGLNPVWLIVALLIGGKLSGILGLLIAVPLASVVKSTTDSLRSAMLPAVESSSDTEARQIAASQT